MAGFEKRTKRYPTDLTDEEWLFVQPFLPPVAKRGRKPATDLRDVLDALRYLARAGGGLRMSPNDSALADGILVVPPLRTPATVSHDPRRHTDARPRTRRA